MVVHLIGQRHTCFANQLTGFYMRTTWVFNGLGKQKYRLLHDIPKTTKRVIFGGMIYTALFALTYPLT